MLEGEVHKEKRPGRPRLPVEEKKRTVNTTLHVQTIDRIEREGWQLNELIADGIVHRDQCSIIKEQLKESLLEKRFIEAGNAKLQRKLQQYFSALEQAGIPIPSDSVAEEVPHGQD